MKPLTNAVFLLIGIFHFAVAHAELPDATRFSVQLELGNIQQARAWLDEGLDPNFEGALIGTGLMIGAWENNIPLMKLFLERGANLDQQNRFNETALMLAAWKNSKEAMQWLLQQGAKPTRPPNEWTALHYATFAGHGKLVDSLLAAGADVNARSTNGSTVLMMAAREGHEAVAKQLLAAGANPALKNEYGDDAISWAMRQGNFDIAKALSSVEDFAKLARQAAENPWQPPQRSLLAPEDVNEQLRMARLAEVDGNREKALVAYQKALSMLKAQRAPRKVVELDDATKNRLEQQRQIKGVQIRAKRAAPEKQVMSFSYEGKYDEDLDKLMQQARAADAAGNYELASQIYLHIAKRVRSGY